MINSERLLRRKCEIRAKQRILSDLKREWSSAFLFFSSWNDVVLWACG